MMMMPYECKLGAYVGSGGDYFDVLSGGLSNVGGAIHSFVRSFT